jgi:NAD(P)H-dependent FMN reductase
MITILSGTNRKNSNTNAVSKIILKKMELKGINVQMCDLQELPDNIFQASSYFNPPESFKPFQDKISQCNGLLVVVPEYNGSFPGALKYFIDLLKFPESLKGIPVGFVGVAAGVFGALRSIEQLELIFQYRESHLFSKRVLFAKVNELLNAEKTKIINEFHDQKIDQLISEFNTFVNKLS